MLNSHADVDHYGGNAAIKQAAPGALFLAHELDVRWIESKEAIMRERYGWYAEHGLDYEPDVVAWLRDAIGPDTPVDVHLCAGERIRLGPRLTLEVLHLPGHTRGPHRPLGAGVPQRHRAWTPCWAGDCSIWTRTSSTRLPTSTSRPISAPPERCRRSRPSACSRRTTT